MSNKNIRRLIYSSVLVFIFGMLSFFSYGIEKSIFDLKLGGKINRELNYLSEIRHKISRNEIVEGQYIEYADSLLKDPTIKEVGLLNFDGNGWFYEGAGKNLKKIETNDEFIQERLKNKTGSRRKRFLEDDYLLEVYQAAGTQELVCIAYSMVAVDNEFKNSPKNVRKVVIIVGLALLIIGLVLIK